MLKNFPFVIMMMNLCMLYRIKVPENAFKMIRIRRIAFKIFIEGLAGLKTTSRYDTILQTVQAEPFRDISSHLLKKHT